MLQETESYQATTEKKKKKKHEIKTTTLPVLHSTFAVQ